MNNNQDFLFKPQDVSIRDRSKVYFACHKLDFEKYFETVTDEILGISYKKKMSILFLYHHPQQDICFEKIKQDLLNIQMIIIPVTKNLLEDVNYITEDLIPFALKHHIPILPLLQERGLEEKYSLPDKFGNLQFLDKYNSDVTALPYDMKLTEFLSSVLIGDELRKKVQAAFDAYIFLSYRKKDRKHAQEIMHLIHENDFCRDIAIWYDEFLTPGEDFNSSIKKALKKSKLFALVVTPNIVEEDNYVVKHEYPMALKQKKKILPLESVPTDAYELRQKFKGIPPCTEVRDKIHLSETLIKNLKHVALQKNDNNPEHSYFIGLAYLNGIDVEVDYERAVALIQAAAEAGVPEALGTLAGMYNVGKGVEKSYSKAEFWSDKLVEFYEQDIKKYCKKLIHVLHIQASLLFTVGNNEKTILIAEKALEYMEDKSHRSMEPQYFQRSIMLRILIFTSKIQGEILRETLVTDSDINRRFIEEYDVIIKECETFKRRQKEDSDGLDVLLYYIYMTIANFHLMLGEFDKYHGKVQKANELNVYKPDDKLQTILDKLIKSVKELQKEPEKSESEWWDIQIELLDYMSQTIAEDTFGNVMNFQLYLIMLGPMANQIQEIVKMRASNLERADILLRMMRDIADKFDLKLALPNALSGTCSIYEAMATVEVLNKNNVAAISNYKRCIEILEHLYKQYPTRNTVILYISIVLDIEKCFLKEEDFLSCEKYLLRAESLWREEFDIENAECDDYILLATLAGALVYLYDQMDDSEKKFNSAFMWLHANQEIYNREKTASSLLDLRGVCDIVAECEYERGKATEALGVSNYNIETYNSLLTREDFTEYSEEFQQGVQENYCDCLFLHAKIFNMEGVNKPEEAIKTMRLFLEKVTLFGMKERFEKKLRIAESYITEWEESENV